MQAPHRILIAKEHDDPGDPFVQSLLGRGHAVLVTQDAHQALRSLRPFQPDVAILDMDMPGLDPCALAFAMRRERARGELVVLGLIRRSRPEDMERLKIAGVDHCAVRPASPDDLCALVDSLLTRAHGDPSTGASVDAWKARSA